MVSFDNIQIYNKTFNILECEVRTT